MPGLQEKRGGASVCCLCVCARVCVYVCVCVRHKSLAGERGRACFDEEPLCVCVCVCVCVCARVRQKSQAGECVAGRVLM